jgi:hypothetical protein
VTILQHKAKALDAYGRYLEDAEGDGEIRDLLERIRDSDIELVSELKDVLAHRLEESVTAGEEGEGKGEGEEEEDESPPPRRGESTQRR